LAWIDKNQLAEKDEFVGRQKELDYIVQEAAKSRAEHEVHRSKIEARTSLENYCFTLRNTIQEDKHKDKFEDPDNEKLEKAMQETFDWLDKNQLAEKDEFEAKQKELVGVANPILVRRRDDQVHDHGKADCFAALSRMAELAKQDRELGKKRKRKKNAGELHRMKVEAKICMENYCLTLRTKLQEEKHKDKFNATLLKAVQQRLDWLDLSQFAEKDDFVDMQEGLESLVQEAAKYRAKAESVRTKIEATASVDELMRLGASLNCDEPG